MIIRRDDPEKTAEIDKKSGAKKKESGLGRGLESLLEDNTPDPAQKASVVRRNEDEDRRNLLRSNDDLYRKEGVMNVKKIKRTWS